MTATPSQNKEIVIRFNEEIIGKGDLRAFRELVAEDVVNHTAPSGTPNGADGMRYFLFEVLRKGFPDVRAEILDQIAEGDKVTTRKVLRGTHTGDFMGIAPTGREVAIKVIDIIRLREGRYAEHWAASDLAEVARALREG